MKDIDYTKQGDLIDLLKESLSNKKIKDVNNYLLDSVKKVKSSKKYSDDVTLLSIRRKKLDSSYHLER